MFLIFIQMWQDPRLVSQILRAETKAKTEIYVKTNTSFIRFFFT